MDPSDETEDRTTILWRIWLFVRLHASDWWMIILYAVAFYIIFFGFEKLPFVPKASTVGKFLNTLWCGLLCWPCRTPT